MNNEDIYKENASCTGNETCILEQNKPLSQSIIWKLQSDFYANQGPSAWIKGIVPQYVTTNPYIADIYAKVVFGYIRDHVSTYGKENTIYILELAAGVGRFSFAFLKRLTRLIERSNYKDVKYKYIITDFAEQNIEFWLNHSYLEPYFESGVLDCASLDMTKDEEIHLRKSGEVLKKNSTNSPVILFANYAFDTLPQDTFYVNEGKLYEGLITVTKSINSNEDVPDNSILANLDYSYENNELMDCNYYEEVEFNAILESYKDTCDSTSFSIPITSLRCLNRIRTVFKGDMVLLSSDKGYNSLDSMVNNNHPYLSKHGSISLTVNLHSVGLYFEEFGGQAIHSIYSYENVTTSLFFLGEKNHEFVDTSLAFYDYIDSIGADDFHTIKQAIVTSHKSYTTRQLLTFLRYSLWDARTFVEFYNTLLERIQEEEDFPREEFVAAIFQIWDNYFPIGEDGNLAYCFGSLLAYFGYDYDAIQFFETSIQFYGEDAAIYYEIALCYVNMEIIENALDALDKSLELEPNYSESLKLRDILLQNIE